MLVQELLHLCARKLEGGWALRMSVSVEGPQDRYWRLWRRVGVARKRYMANLRCIVSCLDWSGAGECSVQCRGLTPLFRASEGGHVECVRLLLDRGAGVDGAGVSCWVMNSSRGLSHAHALHSTCVLIA